ncbi:coiled-coil domain-containing protein 150 isoform X2 [Dicentrarchus labrax]|uniref:coiled-coil domain-containing protein 150 isoform X2 n=1 Tax=Dicentrarchus labrax TaxID=13489 RepID=UPI0021F54AC4|nr:coiled-coil domain-containing protein 150 isoform X2 [Dicentrarchus labrax]
MSRSAVPPFSVGATAPEALSLLHQRLLLAEEEAEALIQDMGVLGVSRDQILGSAERMGATQRPISPLKMRRVFGDEGMLCDSVVSRVCRMESLLQTLKLTIFRLETEKELDPSHTAHLKQQLAALQRQSEEEHHTTRREAMKLRDQLQQAYQERDEARTEMDVALAAEELKIVKLEMSQRLKEMKEQMRQESARLAEATRSHNELHQRVEEMERVVEMQRRQALLLQSDCHALHVEVQTGQRQLEEANDRGRQLDEHCQRLKDQTEMKDSLMSELKTDLKSVCQALQRQQTENSKLLKEGTELRAAADRVQTLNKQLQSQCTQLSSALHSLTEENEKHQASLKAEMSRVVKQLQERDLQLGANIQTELQVALTHKVSLQLELERLKGEHAKLLQSSSIAQETVATQRELLERTTERLRGELNMAKKEEGAMRKDLEDSKNELCLVVTKLEGERSSLETQLSEAKWEVGSLCSVLQSQQDENRRLMGKVAALEQQQHAVQQVDQMLKDLTDKNKPACEKGKLKISELEAVCGPGGGVVSQTLEDILASHTRIQLNGQTLGREQEQKDRLQAQREIRKHQAEVEKLQQLLTSTHSKSNRALESLQKALDKAKADNKRLAQSVEQAVFTNSSLHSKLEQARDQYQATITLRDEELHVARTKIGRLSEELGAIKQRMRGEYDSSMRRLHREITELKMTVKDSSTGSGDLSKANQELRQQVSELEQQVSKQKARIREERRQRQKSRDSQDNSQKVESIKNIEEQEDSKLPQDGMDSQQVLRKREAEWERWTSTIQRWEAKRELAHIAGGSKQSH